MNSFLKKYFSRQRIPLWRQFIQWGFLFWCVFLGVQFGLFVRYYESGGLAPYYARPPGVEAFLPIGALMSFKAWLLDGYFDSIHPAALVLFMTFLAMALLSKKSFCSWVCPVGALEEGLWKTGRKIFGRNLLIWKWLDISLRFIKYVLLFFFVKLILIDMPIQGVKGFMAAPYWAIADVKMLHFFTRMSLFSLGVILLLALLSVIYKNFWCRYLCPYGALLGLISLASPLKIRRQLDLCTDCGTCSRVCPARIDVQNKKSVCSEECTACLTCVGNCPEEGALNVRLSFWKRPLPSWSFALVVIFLFSTGVTSGMLSGHWETSLTHLEYQRLIPLAGKLGH